MPTALVIKHLESWKHKHVAVNVFMAGVALVAALLVLAVTLWIVYGGIYVGTMGVSAAVELCGGKPVNLTNSARLWLCGIFMGLLFLQHLRDGPWQYFDVPELALDPKTGMALATELRIPTAMPLFSVIANPRATGIMVTDVLMSGPRLVWAVPRYLADAFRMGRMDVEALAQLLVFLLPQTKPVPYAELQAAGWGAHFAELRRLAGVVFLEKGVVLTEEFRTELAEVCRER
jgi:hypothetical protein